MIPGNRATAVETETIKMAQSDDSLLGFPYRTPFPRFHLMGATPRICIHVIDLLLSASDVARCFFMNSSAERGKGANLEDFGASFINRQFSFLSRFRQRVLGDSFFEIEG